MIGHKLGHYEVLAPLGAGGMGEVYRAHDTKLRREVALKLLPAELALDPERLARLQREAHLLAALNHPNIAAIHSLEQHEDTRFLVMELVEGETLAEQLERGPMPLQQALAIACQIAHALEAAHEGGIIHRDLKPANVKITPEFVVKVLDFGLAKATDDGPDALSSDLSQSPTLMVEGTQTGVILGTAAYMSPEQARGRALDKRTDIWSFGLVLFEMLSGDTPFAADTLTETLAGILRDEPDWDALPAETPRQVQRLLRRCLRKERGRRLRDIGDARIEIEDALTEPADALPSTEAGLPDVSTVRWRHAIPWTALGVVVGLGAGLLAAGSALRPGPQEPPGLVQTSIVVPTSQQLGRLAISPDGSRIVYSAIDGDERKLFSRPLDQEEATPIPGTEDGDAPFFSPDGKWVGFFADGWLKKVELDTGVGSVELTAAVAPDWLQLAGAWGPDDTIVFLQMTNQPETPGLVRIPASGGALETLTIYDPLKQPPHKDVHVLPDGRAFLFVERRPGVSDGDIVLQSFSTGDAQVLAQGSGPRYVSTGHIVYRRANTLYALPFDAQHPEATSTTPVPVKVGVGSFAISHTGTLIYRAASTPLRELMLVDLQGQAEPLAGMPTGDYLGARFSRDGKRLVTLLKAKREVHLYELEMARRRLLLSAIKHEGEAWTPFSAPPVWSPDGKAIALAASAVESNEFGIMEMFMVPVDGGASERLLPGPESQYPHGWSPDEKRLLYAVFDSTNFATIWEQSLESPGSPRMVVGLPGAWVFSPAVSRDGQWLAYDIWDGDITEVWVKRYGEPGLGTQVSIEGGANAAWAPDGATLYYQHGQEMMAVEITTDPEFEAARPQVLFDGLSPANTIGGYSYDLSPDGDRFVVARPVGESTTASQIHVVLNWFEELKRLVPAGR